MTTTGYLITNLGTPASPREQDVRTYLDEFLMDPHVVDLPRPLRRLLLSLVILRTRPRRSAEAYRAIWTDDGTPMGSPLLAISTGLAEALERELAAPVALGMRYGSPSLRDGITQLLARGVTRLVVAPLYPQFADSTVTTTREAVARVIDNVDNSVQIDWLPPFYREPAFIDALAQTVRSQPRDTWDHLLLSYHGLPERHLTRADPTIGHCLQHPNCCEVPSPAHATCYRHQVFATSRALAATLDLDPTDWSVSFQSRLGRLPWLRPYTDETLAELPGRGIRRLLVACPAFVADNLETLEEMAMQGRETFLAAGGESFTVLPCVNTDEDWVRGLAGLLSERANQGSEAGTTN